MVLTDRHHGITHRSLIASTPIVSGKFTAFDPADSKVSAVCLAATNFAETPEALADTSETVFRLKNVRNDSDIPKRNLKPINSTTTGQAMLLIRLTTSSGVQLHICTSIITPIA
jgi:hypothetical protein